MEEPKINRDIVIGDSFGTLIDGVGQLLRAACATRSFERIAHYKTVFSILSQVSIFERISCDLIHDLWDVLHFDMQHTSWLPGIIYDACSRHDMRYDNQHDALSCRGEMLSSIPHVQHKIPRQEKMVSFALQCERADLRSPTNLKSWLIDLVPLPVAIDPQKSILRFQCKETNFNDHVIPFFKAWNLEQQRRLLRIYFWGSQRVPLVSFERWETEWMFAKLQLFLGQICLEDALRYWPLKEETFSFFCSFLHDIFTLCNSFPKIRWTKVIKHFQNEAKFLKALLESPLGKNAPVVVLNWNTFSLFRSLQQNTDEYMDKKFAHVAVVSLATQFEHAVQKNKPLLTFLLEAGHILDELKLPKDLSHLHHFLSVHGTYSSPANAVCILQFLDACSWIKQDSTQECKKRKQNILCEEDELLWLYLAAKRQA